MPVDASADDRFAVYRILQRREWHKSPQALDLALRFVVGGGTPDGRKRRVEMLESAAPWYSGNRTFSEAMRQLYDLVDYVEAPRP